MSIREYAINTISLNNEVPETVLVNRQPLDQIGRSERSVFMWFLVDETGDGRDLQTLKDPVTGDSRYRVTFATLQAEYPFFDIGRATDPNDEYQPFLDPDPATGIIRSVNVPALSSSGVEERVSGAIIFKAS